MHRTFARSYDSLEPLFEFTGDFAQRNRMDESVVYAMNLAVEELFTNMVKYGGGGDEVSVRLDVRGSDLVIRIDHPGAAPFDVSKTDAADVERPLAERVPGGIGLHLVRRIMDTFDYEYLDGVARVTLTKRLGGS
jgi:anti-sigma regulatory factor (Ser/Thr protein kinase)